MGVTLFFLNPKQLVLIKAYPLIYTLSVLDVVMKVGLRQSYFQLVGQDSVWYVAMYIQTSARLKNGS